LLQGARIRPASYLGVSLWNRSFAQADQEFILREPHPVPGHPFSLEHNMNNVNQKRTAAGEA
jgi:hypothetical protein